MVGTFAILVILGYALLLGVLMPAEAGVPPGLLPSQNSSVEWSPTVTDGLRLIVTVEPIKSTQGSSDITVIADMVNTLGHQISVNFPANSSASASPNQAITTSVMVYSGHYVYADLTHAIPLSLGPPCAQICFLTIPYTNDQALDSFIPNDHAGLLPIQFGAGTGISIEYTLKGYYTDNPYHQSMMPFLGEYTVVVSDALGQNAIAYFDVTN